MADKRVLQSKEMIENALWELMKRESFWDLSVMQICQEAQISRNTFYRLYDSKETLLRQYLGKIIKQSLGRFDEREDFHFDTPSKEEIERTYLRFYTFWNEKHEFLDVVFRRNLQGVFHREFCMLTKNKVSDEAIAYYETEMRSAVGMYYYGWLTSALCSILETWTLHGFRETPQQLTKITIHLYQSLHYQFEA